MRTPEAEKIDIALSQSIDSYMDMHPDHVCEAITNDWPEQIAVLLIEFFFKTSCGKCGGINDFIEIERPDPELRGRPIVVAPMIADTTSAIAASYEAKAYGIKTGTPIWEAKKLCPDLKVVQARPKLYVEYHHKIANAIESRIPIEAVVSIDEVACRLDKIQCQPDNAKALALDIKAAIREKAGPFLTCSIGIAANRLLAKLASDMHKPDGLH